MSRCRRKIRIASYPRSNEIRERASMSRNQSLPTIAFRLVRGRQCSANFLHSDSYETIVRCSRRTDALFTRLSGKYAASPRSRNLFIIPLFIAERALLFNRKCAATCFGWRKARTPKCTFRDRLFISFRSRNPAFNS